VSPVEFLARKVNGSFCVDVGIQVVGGLQREAAVRIQAWINDVWMPRYETPHYGDEFATMPAFAAGPGSELQLRLIGQKTAEIGLCGGPFRLVPVVRRSHAPSGTRGSGGPLLRHS
jgi:hypothetical protein